MIIGKEYHQTMKAHRHSKSGKGYFAPLFHYDLPVTQFVTISGHKKKDRVFAMKVVQEIVTNRNSRFL
jgi:hypothetical protein